MPINKWEIPFWKNGITRDGNDGRWLVHRRRPAAPGLVSYRKTGCCAKNKNKCPLGRTCRRSKIDSGFNSMFENAGFSSVFFETDFIFLFDRHQQRFYGRTSVDLARGP